MTRVPYYDKITTNGYADSELSIKVVVSLNFPNGV